MATKILIGLSFVLLGVGICSMVILFRSRYRDLNETIQEGIAYGFSIGDSKQKTFARLAEWSTQQQVRWVTVESYTIESYEISQSYPQSLEEVVGEFSEWETWYIYGIDIPEITVVCLSFHALDDQAWVLKWIWYETPDSKIWNTTPDSKAKPFSPPWLRTDDIFLRVTPGMSSDAVFHTLLELSNLDAYKSMRLRPAGFRYVTMFTPHELARLEKWDLWHVDLYPLVGGYGENYIRFRFANGRLVEINRWKSAPDFWLDVSSIF